MDAHKITPKDFFLYLFGAIALYASASTAITLLWQLVNLALPETRGYADADTAGMVRWAIAVLVVAFPAYAWTMWRATEEVVREPGKDGMWVRRWYIGANVFLGGLIAAGDLVALLYGFLEGELTLRFVLKAAVVLAVAGSVCLYYLRQWRGVPPKAVRKAALAAASLALAAGIVGGIALTGSPATARATRNDAVRVQDLMQYQFEIATYWERKRELPANAADLVDPANPVPLPVDPETGAPYRYEKRGELAYALCAVFEAELDPASSQSRYVETGDVPEAWAHGKGEHCFSRTIDPARYPEAVR